MRTRLPCGFPLLCHESAESVESVEGEVVHVEDHLDEVTKSFRRKRFVLAGVEKVATSFKTISVGYVGV